MELKNRSFRVSDATVERIQKLADDADAPMYVVLAAAVDYFDPVENEEHRQALEDTVLKFKADDLAAQIDSMSPEMKQALLKKLKAK